MVKAEIGDYVKIVFGTKEYSGKLLEVPRDEKGIILLKLNSGYNIGLNKKEILEIEVLKKAEKIEENINFQKPKNKPEIGLVMTGGTISSELDRETGAVKWLTSPEKMFKFYPGMFEYVNISKIEIPFMKGSENLDYKDWQKIARSVEKLLKLPNIRGVIVTHGTDTLHYTAAALSFFLRNLNKPVVLTYSQRSTDRASSDALLNLECSAIATLSDIKEVFVVGHGSTNDEYCYALRGTKVRKLHSSRRDAFKPVNISPIAKIKEDKIEIISNYKSRSEGKLKLDSKFEENVALIKFYPGQNPDILDYYLKKKYKGIVIELLGLGQIASREARLSWIKKLKEVIEKGIAVCGTAQTIYGRLDPLVYSTGRELRETGLIYLEDMLSETAFVKLGWVLGHSEWSKSSDKIREKMLENIAGEFNNRLE